MKWCITGHERDYVRSVDVGGLDRAAELAQISSSRSVSTSVHQPTTVHLQTYKSSCVENTRVKVRACHKKKETAAQTNIKTRRSFCMLLWHLCRMFSCRACTVCPGWLMQLPSLSWSGLFIIKRCSTLLLSDNLVEHKEFIFSLALLIIVVEWASAGQLFQIIQCWMEKGNQTAV